MVMDLTAEGLLNLDRLMADETLLRAAGPISEWI